MDFSGHSAGDPAARKPALRATLLARRRAMTGPQRRSAADRLLTAVLAALPVPDGLTVAAHSPMPAEPGGRLPDVLREAGYRVLLPITLPDNDLDWAQYRDDLRPGPRGPAEPTGPRLGPAAITQADAVIVPALAVGPDGHRLGRGRRRFGRRPRSVLPRTVVPRTVVPLADDEA